MVKILLIEDSLFERKSIIQILKKVGYKDFVEADNGLQGLGVYKTEKPDLVLLDLRMPGKIAGLNTFRELKKIDSNVKCIIVSIIRKEETKEEAIKLGVKAYVEKPVTKEKLVPVVEKALKG